MTGSLIDDARRMMRGAGKAMDYVANTWDSIEKPMRGILATFDESLASYEKDLRPKFESAYDKLVNGGNALDKDFKNLARSVKGFISPFPSGTSLSGHMKGFVSRGNAVLDDIDKLRKNYGASVKQDISDAFDLIEEGINESYNLLSKSSDKIAVYTGNIGKTPGASNQKPTPASPTITGHSGIGAGSGLGAYASKAPSVTTVNHGAGSSSPEGGGQPVASSLEEKDEKNDYENDAGKKITATYRGNQKKDDLAARVKAFCESMKPFGKFEFKFDFEDTGVTGYYWYDNEQAKGDGSGLAKTPAPSYGTFGGSPSGSGIEGRLNDDGLGLPAESTAQPGDHDLSGFAKTARFVSSLYNNGLNYREIKRVAGWQGIVVKSYDEMLGLVAANIANGGEYMRYNYNRKIAEHLGLNEFVVKAKQSGMTYSQIKDVVKERANGMNISRSTVKRLLKKHFEEQVAASQPEISLQPEAGADSLAQTTGEEAPRRLSVA